MSIKKIALLIAYQEEQGFSSRAAQGMRRDVENVANFLKSPYGGAWHDSEIILKFSPSKSEILQLLDLFSAEKDYAFIVFFGHGRYSEDYDDVMLQLNPTEEIPSLSLRNRVPKELIVLDCCRAISGEDIITEGIERFAAQRKMLDVVACRDLYNNCILLADKGNTVLYACSPGEKSYGTTSGGNYTRNLLFVTRKWEEDLAKTAIAGRKYIFSVVKAHMEASKETERRQNIQHPDIEKSRSGVYLPFAVAVYEEAQ